MNVNWQNLGIAIQKGTIAFDNANLGSPMPQDGTSFYDHPMSDLASAAALADKLNPNGFVIGSSKWGGSDLVTG